MRTNYLISTNVSSSASNPPLSSSFITTLNTTPLSSSNSTEQRSSFQSDPHASNQFKPIHDHSTVIYANVAPIPTVRPLIANNILALQEKFQMRSSPVNTSSSSPVPSLGMIYPQSTTTIVNPSSPLSTNSSSTAATIQSNKQITVQDIDTNVYEEILAKEPDLNRRPEKSALKKSTGLKRRVIPVFRENQRPSPRPSPKFKPVVLDSSPKTGATRSNDGQSTAFEQNDQNNSSSDEDGDNNGADAKKPFANVKRNDSLARFLRDRPLPNELYEKHILVKPVDERKHEREHIETKLERKLSLRPSLEELEARNILRAKTADELIAEKEEKKRYLIRKLSFRPSIQGEFHSSMRRLTT